MSRCGTTREETAEQKRCISIYLGYAQDISEIRTGSSSRVSDVPSDLQTPCPMFKYVDDSTVFDVCNNSSAPMSSRKMRVLAHFTIHMVEIIQLYTDQPHTWLGFRYHPSSSVFQPYVWLGTISNSLNNTK